MRTPWSISGKQLKELGDKVPRREQPLQATTTAEKHVEARYGSMNGTMQQLEKADENRPEV